MSTKKLTQLSLLTAAALVLYVIEMQLPTLIPVPGVKLGLANIITVVAIYRFRFSETVLLVGVRIFLGALFAVGMSALIFSASGAILCLLGMGLLKKIIPAGYLPLSSVFGAIFHNVGQVGAAVWVLKSPGVLAYLPILLVSGCITGLFTGICAQLVQKRVNCEKRLK